MLRKTFNLVSVLTISVFLLSGCGKDGDDSKSKTTLLTQSDWKRTSLMITINTNPPYDDHQNSAPCIQDDRFVFRTNGSYEVNEGPTKCNTGDPQVKTTGTWAFTDNESKLTISSSSFIIDQLTESTLVITYTVVAGPNTTVTKGTYVH
jgi:hypothetical protein